MSQETKNKKSHWHMWIATIAAIVELFLFNKSGKLQVTTTGVTNEYKNT